MRKAGEVATIDRDKYFRWRTNRIHMGLRSLKRNDMDRPASFC